MSYDTDFVAWADRQASLLRQIHPDDLDWENIAEEIESLASSTRREIRNRLRRVCANLLKLAYDPDEEPRRRWKGNVIQQRRQISDLLEESPSLHDYPASILHEAYDNAISIPEDHNWIAPKSCPWTITNILNPEFWPGE